MQMALGHLQSKFTLVKVCTCEAKCQDEEHDTCTGLPGTPACCVASPDGMTIISQNAEHFRWNGNE